MHVLAVKNDLLPNGHGATKTVVGCCCSLSRSGQQRDALPPVNLTSCFFGSSLSRL